MIKKLAEFMVMSVNDFAKAKRIPIKEAFAFSVKRFPVTVLFAVGWASVCGGVFA